MDDRAAVGSWDRWLEDADRAYDDLHSGPGPGWWHRAARRHRDHRAPGQHQPGARSANTTKGHSRDQATVPDASIAKDDDHDPF